MVDSTEAVTESRSALREADLPVAVEAIRLLLPHVVSRALHGDHATTGHTSTLAMAA